MQPSLLPGSSEDAVIHFLVPRGGAVRVLTNNQPEEGATCAEVDYVVRDTHKSDDGTYQIHSRLGVGR